MNRAVFTEEVVEDLDIKVEKNVNNYGYKPVRKSDIKKLGIELKGKAKPSTKVKLKG